MNFESLALEAGYTKEQAAYIGRKLTGVESIERIARHINGRLAGDDIGVLAAKLANAEKSLKKKSRAAKRTAKSKE